MRTIILLLAPLTFGLACASGGGGEVKPVTSSEIITEGIVFRKLPPPAHIPSDVRAKISARMKRHGQTMSEIWKMVIGLEFTEAGELAYEIADNPALSRPLSQEDEELTKHLPVAFFELQEELSARARVFAGKVVTGDPPTVAGALGDLTDTCISCHTAYLKDPGTI